jgi:hypothetical protein
MTGIFTGGRKPHDYLTSTNGPIFHFKTLKRAAIDYVKQYLQEVCISDIPLSSPMQYTYPPKVKPISISCLSATLSAESYHHHVLNAAWGLYRRVQVAPVSLILLRRRPDRHEPSHEVYVRPCQAYVGRSCEVMQLVRPIRPAVRIWNNGGGTFQVSWTLSTLILTSTDHLTEITIFVFLQLEFGT